MGDRLECEPIPLPSLSIERASVLLSPPEMPSHAVAEVALARAAAEAVVPLLLVAPANARPLAIVRALHALAHRSGPVLVWNAESVSPALAGDGATVVIDANSLGSRSLVTLEAHLDEPSAWLVVVSDDVTHLPASLASRLRPAVLTIPPLARRRADLPALVQAILGALSQRSGRPAPVVTPAALRVLEEHPWPAGRIELEAALARAMLLAGPAGTIEPSLLDLAAAPPPVASAEASSAMDAHGPRLEYLLAELAHELRNPLVTIKTFAQQLPALLEDEELRTRFAELTDEAVGRMDGLLENVLAFARLPAPHVEDLDVGLVLDGVLGDVTPALDERDVHVRRVGEGARCLADRDHLSYALRNLLVGIAHETPPRQELLVDASTNGVVSLHFGTGAAISRLRDLAAPQRGAGLDDPTFLPLAFTLARAVLERTGGQLGIVPSLGGQATVTVRLPPTVPGEITR